MKITAICSTNLQTERYPAYMEVLSFLEEVKNYFLFLIKAQAPLLGKCVVFVWFVCVFYYYWSFWSFL